MVVGHIDLPMSALVNVCRKYQVRELSLFGSALRDDFRDDSDIDLLVEFIPGHSIGFIEYLDCQMELTEVLGRKVDLVDKQGVKPRLANRILGNAKVLYSN
ncbi:MAG TPA: nucleotidyltransferase domain-containing protein [Phycisphaerae bacterium]|jgi:predicted nucleotidyltransferase|nr:nucleotidyltransferase domain-containing protein [Phycisphaerae bacterium]